MNALRATQGDDFTENLDAFALNSTRINGQKIFVRIVETQDSASLQKKMHFYEKKNKKSLQNKKKQYLCALKLEIDYWQLNIRYTIINQK